VSMKLQGHRWTILLDAGIIDARQSKTSLFTHQSLKSRIGT